MKPGIVESAVLCVASTAFAAGAVKPTGNKRHVAENSTFERTKSFQKRDKDDD